MNGQDLALTRKLIDKYGGGTVSDDQLNSAIDKKIADGTIASGEQLETIAQQLPKYSLRYDTVTSTENFSTFYDNLSLIGIRKNPKTNKTIGYVYVRKLENNNFDILYATSKHEAPMYLTKWNKSLCYDRYSTPFDYSCTVTTNGDLIFVFRGEQLYVAENTIVENARQNPIIYKHNDYSNPFIINFDSLTNDDGASIIKKIQKLNGWSVDIDRLRNGYANNVITYFSTVALNEEINIVVANNSRFILLGFVGDMNCRNNMLGEVIVSNNSLKTYTFINTKYDSIALYLQDRNSNNNPTISIIGKQSSKLNKYIDHKLLFGTTINNVENKIIVTASLTPKSLFIDLNKNAKYTFTKKNGDRFRIAFFKDRINLPSLIYDASEGFSVAPDFIAPTTDSDTKFEYVNTEYSCAVIYTNLNAGNGSVTVKEEIIIDSDISKPTAWLQNCGCEVLNDGTIVFAEYTRPCHANCYVWKISYPYDEAYNWRKVKSFTVSGSMNVGFKHSHLVNYDKYSDTLYLATGDDDEGAKIFYSKDKGANWILLKEGSEKYCRLLNFIFTKEFVYWATDTGKNDLHFLFKCNRDSKGIIDFSNIQELYKFPNRIEQQATYCTAYYENYNGLLILDRCDAKNISPMNVYFYDLNLNKMYILDVLKPIENAMWGFRNDVVDWYADNNNNIICGFGYSKNYIDILGNTVNNPINNLILQINKN